MHLYHVYPPLLVLNQIGNPPRTIYSSLQLRQVLTRMILHDHKLGQGIIATIETDDVNLASSQMALCRQSGRTCANHRKTVSIARNG